MRSSLVPLKQAVLCVTSLWGWQQSFAIEGEWPSGHPCAAREGSLGVLGGGHAAWHCHHGHERALQLSRKDAAPAWLCTSCLVSTSMDKACFQEHLQFVLDVCHPPELLIMFFIRFWFNAILLW